MATVSCSTEAMVELRCRECGKLLGYVDGRVQIKCPRCKAMVTAKSLIKP